MRRDVSRRQMRVIAITGTSGKTTTAWLTASVLAEAGLRVGVLSDLGYLGPEDLSPTAANYRTPDGLPHWLSGLSADGCTHAVVEVSRQLLAARALAGVAVDTVVVTSLPTPRRSRLGTRRRPALAGTALAAAILGPEGCLVSGCDAAGQATLESELPPDATLITAGLTERSAVRATAVEGGLFGRTVLASWGGQTMPLSLDTPTVPFVRDSLLAIAVGGRYGVSLPACVRGVEAAGNVPGRMERLDRGQDAAVFIDSPTSRHALAATLASLRRLTPGRLVVIAEEPFVARFGGGGFGPLIARHADASIVAPATVLADEPGEGDVTAYARIDRLLDSLRAEDCCLLLGRASPRRRPASHFPLVSLVDAWLQLALDPSDPCRRRAA
jgi:UDP-N-acetylmuramoyl-L-alanyl-D-glutamate--2,6-diaminopimelate ligase